MHHHIMHRRKNCNNNKYLDRFVKFFEWILSVASCWIFHDMTRWWLRSSWWCDDNHMRWEQVCCVLRSATVSPTELGNMPIMIVNHSVSYEYLYLQYGWLLIVIISLPILNAIKYNKKNSRNGLRVGSSQWVVLFKIIVLYTCVYHVWIFYLKLCKVLTSHHKILHFYQKRDEMKICCRYHLPFLSRLSIILCCYFCL